MDNRDVKRYLREVKRWLPCRRKLKKHIIGEIEHNLAAFAAEVPKGGYDAIVARFGTPQQIASAYVDELETPELLKDLLIKRRIISAVAAGVAAVVLVWAVAVGMLYIEGCNNVNGTGTMSGVEVYDATYPN